MTRDDLEAEIWRAMRKRREQHRELAASGPVSTRDLTALDTTFVLMVLRAADEYRNGGVTETPTEAELREKRRAVLARAPSRCLHYIPFDGRQDEFACHPAGSATGTTDTEAVSCIRCLRTDAYKNDQFITGRAS